MPQPEEFDVLVDRRALPLLRLAVMLTGNRSDAEDLLQSTLERAFAQRARVMSADAPGAYLRRVMINEHLRGISRSRTRPRQVSLDGHDPVVIDQGPEDQDEIWRLLAGLTAPQRAVLVLRYYEGLPDAEIALVLQLPRSTVRSHPHRGLAALRDRLPRRPEGVTQ